MNIIRSTVYSILSLLMRMPYAGRRFLCPLCETRHGRFRKFGVIPRKNAQCPACGSLERHRLLWVALQSLWAETGCPGGNLLHIAPEKPLSARLKQLFSYVSIDLDGSRAMRAMDITSLSFPNEYFDAIICNHVLEHIPDDARALSELYRVLRPGGWAIIQVPITGMTTREDPAITDAQGRLRNFGQEDHVRSYGRDFKQRLEHAGFSVQIIPKSALGTTELLEQLSVQCESEVWISHKRDV